MKEESRKSAFFALVGIAGIYATYRYSKSLKRMIEEYGEVRGLPPFSETTMNILATREKEVQTDTNSEPSAPPMEDLNIAPVVPLPPPTMSRVKQINAWIDRVVHFNFY